MVFLTSKDYIEDLKQELFSRPKYIQIICFKMVNDKMVQELKPALLDALHHGAQLKIFADAIYSKHNVSIGFFPSFSRKKREEETKLKAKNLLFFNELRLLGAEVRFVNEPGAIGKYLMPFQGRDHRKVVLIRHAGNKTIAYFGAANLDEGEQNDYMVKVTDHRIVEAVAKSAQYTDTYSPPNDLVFDCDGYFTLLMDRGKPFYSTIYKEGLKLIKSAEKRIVYVSQLPPEPSIMRFFVRAARRNVSVEVVLPDRNHHNISGFPFNAVYKFAEMQAKRSGIKIIHSSKGFTHAKILLVDKIALVGSHNMSYAGVMSGTVELSAEISDPEFVREVEEFIEELK